MSDLFACFFICLHEISSSINCEEYYFSNLKKNYGQRADNLGDLPKIFD